ncbi:MAG: creatininase family protein [Candidatus Krumholzibacteria bacterium]|nr:creatininase family protein [Candidatus Krumholzibacteria bacterium]
MIPRAYDLGATTTDEVARLRAQGATLVALVPVGAIEPHGPHLPLVTDAIISTAACVAAAKGLSGHGLRALVAPGVPYGVTECASAFAGAVSVSADALSAFLGAVVEGLLRDGFTHVCLVNNHLEPAQVAAVRAAIAGLAGAQASVACPVDRRWARTLSDEFKSGACHAGEYETSILLAAAPELVDEGSLAALPEVPVSLSEKLASGVGDFVAMGLARAYAGRPAAATRAHGEEMIARLAAMVVGEVREALGGD